MNRAYLVDATRTPFGHYGGAIAGVRCDDLAALPLIASKERHSALDWTALDEVILGCANQSGEDNRNVARMAMTVAHALRRHGQRRALVSLCVGVGQDVALALEGP